MHWPDIDPNDDRWESRLLRFMSPPEQTADSRKRFYFSLFYTVTHVFALMNVFLYWTIQVPNGHAHWPSGDGDDSGDGADFFRQARFVVMEGDEDGHSAYPPFKDIFQDGWFPAFSIFNLFVFPAILTIIESVFLNSMRRQEVIYWLVQSIRTASLTLALPIARSQPPVWYHCRRCAVLGLCLGWQSCHWPQSLFLDG